MASVDCEVVTGNCGPHLNNDIVDLELKKLILNNPFWEADEKRREVIIILKLNREVALRTWIASKYQIMENRKLVMLQFSC
jgi:hypothetical protein